MHNTNNHHPAISHLFDEKLLYQFNNNIKFKSIFIAQYWAFLYIFFFACITIHHINSLLFNINLYKICIIFYTLFIWNKQQQRVFFFIFSCFSHIRAYLYQQASIRNWSLNIIFINFYFVASASCLPVYDLMEGFIVPKYSHRIEHINKYYMVKICVGTYLYIFLIFFDYSILSNFHFFCC